MVNLADLDKALGQAIATLQVVREELAAARTHPERVATPIEPHEAHPGNRVRMITEGIVLPQLDGDNGIVRLRLDDGVQVTMLKAARYERISP